MFAKSGIPTSDVLVSIFARQLCACGHIHYLARCQDRSTLYLVNRISSQALAARSAPVRTITTRMPCPASAASAVPASGLSPTGALCLRSSNTIAAAARSSRAARDTPSAAPRLGFLLLGASSPPAPRSIPMPLAPLLPPVLLLAPSPSEGPLSPSMSSDSLPAPRSLATCDPPEPGTDTEPASASATDRRLSKLATAAPTTQPSRPGAPLPLPLEPGVLPSCAPGSAATPYSSGPAAVGAGS